MFTGKYIQDVYFVDVYVESIYNRRMHKEFLKAVAGSEEESGTRGL